MFNKYSSKYFEKRKYFQQNQIVERTYGKILKILSFLIILHLFSFFVSLIIFEFENNNEIEYLATTDISSQIKLKIHPSRFVLIMLSFLNCFIVCVEFIYLKLELLLMNQKNLQPNSKKCFSKNNVTEDTPSSTLNCTSGASSWS